MTKDKKYQNRRFFAFGKNDFDFAIATHVQGTTIRERESEYPILSWQIGKVLNFIKTHLISTAT